MFGKLYLCATPIGNLEDITIRVINTLKEVDLIAAEDTRHSIKLLNHYDIKTPMTSYHEFNKFDKGEYLIGVLKEGKNIALITDAGTPAISDPGEELVKMAYNEGIEVTSLPGACAAITALTLSGLSTRRFIFEGFLPSDKKELARILDELKADTRTIIFYEAPHRLKKTLSKVLEVLGDREITIIRELTKRYETVQKSSLIKALDMYKSQDPRGEYVIIVEGMDKDEIARNLRASWQELSVKEHLTFHMDKGMDKKEAMKRVAKDRGVSKRDIYQELIDK